MKHCIIFGSPRADGNTSELVDVLTEELASMGHEYTMFSLYDMDIKPCTACRACQKDWKGFSCSRQDDVQIIFDFILECDSIILATPIYSWYCTPPMKALLDRLVYGMNKYYGDEKGPSLWRGKIVSAITTCGYPPEKGSDLFVEGIKRYCKHSELIWKGALIEKDPGYKSTFMDKDKEKRTKNFANKFR